MFAKMKTGTKVLAGFGIGVLVAVIVGTVGYRGINSVAKHVEDLGVERLPSTQALLEIKGYSEQLKTAQRTLLNLSCDMTVRQRQAGNIAKSREGYQAAWKVYDEMAKNAEQANLWKECDAAYQEWRSDNNQFLKLSEQFDEMLNKCPGAKNDKFALTDALTGSLSQYRLVEQSLARQVHEWKNILLRGNNAAEFEKAFAAFQKEEASFQAELSRLKSMVAEFGFDTQPVVEVARLHTELGVKYREALKNLDKSKADSARTVDQAVRGFDRPVTAMLDAIATAITEKQTKLHELEEKMAVQSNTVCRLSQTKAVDVVDKLLKINQEQGAEGVASAQSEARTAVWTMITAIGLGAAIMTVLGIFLAKSISSVLRKLVNETNRLTEASIAGKLQTRGHVDLVSLEFQPIIEGVNSTLDALIAPLNVTAEYVDRISKGDIPEKITDIYNGDFNEIKMNLNQCIDAINGMVGDAVTLAEAGEKGNLDVRADEHKYNGAWKKIIHGMNKTLEGFMTPIQDISQVLQRMGDKDFTSSVDKEYPGEYGVLRDNVNLVIGNMRGAIQQIGESAAQFAEGSRTIAESAQSLAQGAQTQSASVEEMTASTEELSRSVNAVKDNANESTRVAAKSSQLAEEGGKAVQKSIESMEQIRNSSQKISEIIQVIAEIASQTNLLALNAAIEAARAGEHGMGFAVVADEVRKLAERSNQAAREISSLIRESTQRVEEGAQLSAQTGEALKQIIKAADETAGKITEIAAATVQQAANTEEASKAIQGVSAVTEQAAAGSEEMAASSEQLGAQATALRELVGQFRVGTDGKADRLAGSRR